MDHKIQEIIEKLQRQIDVQIIRASTSIGLPPLNWENGQASGMKYAVSLLEGLIDDN